MPPGLNVSLIVFLTGMLLILISIRLGTSGAFSSLARKMKRKKMPGSARDRGADRLQRLEPREPGWVDRALRRKPRYNAFVAMVNHVCDNLSDLRLLTDRRMGLLVEQFGFDPRRSFRKELRWTFQHVARELYDTGRFSEDDRAQLEHLADLFGLSSRARRKCLRLAAEAQVRGVLQPMVAKGRIDEADREKLENLFEHLDLPQDRIDEIRLESAMERLRPMLDELLMQPAISPADAGLLEVAASDLMIELRMDSKTQEAFDRKRLYWDITEGELPEISVDLHLQRNETCHAQRQVVWHELRKVTRAFQYAGPTLRIRMAKGLYLRGGHLALRRVSREEMKEIDRGRLLVTSKRLLFIGTKGNKTIRLSRIIDFSAFSNGVEIQKDRGRNPFLEFKSNIDVFALVLDRCIRDSRA